MTDPLPLTDWGVQNASDDPFVPPEVGGACLVGACPERCLELGLDPADRITTSPVVGYDPATQVATTRSGTRYRLVGPPVPDYARWCEFMGHDPMAALGVPK